MTTTTVHVRTEVLRTFRNRRMLIFTLGLPLVLLFTVGATNRHATTAGVSFPLYFTAAMAAYGALFAVFSPGSRIAVDRTSGWTRHMRITPLRARTYFLAKVVAAYVVVLPTLALVYVAGLSIGVHLSPSQWLEMTGLLLVALGPFVLIGIIVGHLISVDALAPTVGALVVVFALFGGAFGDFFHKGVMLTATKLLPSFWMVRSGQAALGSGWPLEGWLVVAVWTLVLVPVAYVVYRRDTDRV
jgi:ABC-2 type transport system permease protein